MCVGGAGTQELSIRANNIFNCRESARGCCSRLARDRKLISEELREHVPRTIHDQAVISDGKSGDASALIQSSPLLRSHLEREQ